MIRMTMYQKGFASIGLFVLIALLLVGGMGYFVMNGQTMFTFTEKESASVNSYQECRDAGYMMRVTSDIPGTALDCTTPGGRVFANPEYKGVVPKKTEQSATAPKDETANWKTYQVETYGFKISYPTTWRIFGKDPQSGIAFGKSGQDTNYDGELFLRIEKTTARSAAQLVADQKLVEKDRSSDSIIETSQIAIDGAPATLLVVKSAELRRASPTWEYDMVVFEKNGWTYVLSNGAIKSDNFEKFYESFKFTAKQALSVPGMSKYTDAEFGFSFWYPNDWKVLVSGVKDPDIYPDGTIKKQLFVTPTASGFRGVSIAEYYSPSKTFTSSGGCGPAADCPYSVRYYFDSDSHTWMLKTSYQYPGGTSSQADTVAPANVSTNTMGGLHQLGGNVRFGDLQIIPLSAHNFLLIGQGGAPGDQEMHYLAKTIVAVDPSVATPVSVEEQIKTIQAEKDAYAR